MKKITLIFISLIALSSCTTPIDVAKEGVIQDANISIEKEKTKQLQYQWKIDSLKSVKK
jgi:hypothetical protein